MKLILVTFYVIQPIRNVIVSIYNQHEILLTRYFSFPLYTNLFISSIYFYNTSQFRSPIVLKLNSHCWLEATVLESIVLEDKDSPGTWVCSYWDNPNSRLTAVEVVRNGWVLIIFWRLSQQDLMMDWMCGMRESKQARMTPKTPGLGNWNYEIAIYYNGKHYGSTRFSSETIKVEMLIIIPNWCLRYITLHVV